MRIVLLLLLAGTMCVHAQETKRELWVAWTTGEHLLHDGTKLPFWGFSKSFAQPELPGPLMTTTVGDSLILDVRNQSQPYAHTIHLHGTDVEQEYDGVPGLSWQLDHMETGTYRMLAPHPGLYLYHCHVASVLHVQLGMYGPLLVMPKDVTTSWEGGYAVHPQRTVSLFSDVDQSWHDEVPEHPHRDEGTLFEVPAFEPDYFLVNGNSATTQEVAIPPGTSMWYVGNLGFTAIRLRGLQQNNFAEIVSSDGRPLPSPLLKDELLVMPGERYGLLVNEQQSAVTVDVDWVSMNTEEVLHTKQLAVDVVTSIDAEHEENWHCYYSPATESIVVSSELPLRYSHAQVVDLMGREVPVRLHSANNELHVQLLEPASGIVLLRLLGVEEARTAKVMIHR